MKKLLNHCAAFVAGALLVIGVHTVLTIVPTAEATYQPIAQGQVLSTDNSQTVTSSEASPGSPWVGTWETTRDNNYIRQLVVVVGTTSAISGTFTFEYGEDCSTAIISEERQIDDFETLRDFDLLNAGACFRVKFEPDSGLGAESVIITTTHLKTYQGPFVRLGNQEIEEQNAAMGQTFAYVKGFRTGGKSIGWTMTRGGAGIIAMESVEVARGNVPGSTAVSKFGRNPDVDTTGTPEDVWLAGGAYTGHPTGSPETITVVSSSALDTSAGAGMRTMRIEGLATSSSTEYTTEDVTLNGILGVTTTGTWYRVNRAYGLTGGSGGTNDGDITIRHTTTATNVFAVISAGAGQTAAGAYTVPADNTLFITGLDFEMGRANGSAGACNVVIQTRALSSSMWRNRRNYELTTSITINPPLEYPIIIDEQTDIRLRVVSCSDNNSVITGGFQGKLIAD